MWSFCNMNDLSLRNFRFDKEKQINVSMKMQLYCYCIDYCVLMYLSLVFCNLDLLICQVKSFLLLTDHNVIITRYSYSIFQAKKLGVPILSSVYADRCIEAGKLLPPSEYPSLNIEDYDKGKFPSIRKLKSMTIR